MPSFLIPSKTGRALPYTSARYRSCASSWWQWFTRQSTSSGSITKLPWTPLLPTSRIPLKVRQPAPQWRIGLYCGGVNLDAAKAKITSSYPTTTSEWMQYTGRKISFRLSFRSFVLFFERFGLCRTENGFATTNVAAIVFDFKMADCGEISEFKKTGCVYEVVIHYWGSFLAVQNSLLINWVFLLTGILKWVWMKKVACVSPYCPMSIWWQRHSKGDKWHWWRWRVCITSSVYWILTCKSPLPSLHSCLSQRKEGYHLHCLQIVAVSFVNGHVKKNQVHFYDAEIVSLVRRCNRRSLLSVSGGLKCAFG